jgi:two-component system sensor histidine kinase/response regulator
MDGLSAPAALPRFRSHPLIWELGGLVLVAALWLLEPALGLSLSPLLFLLLLLPFAIGLALYVRGLQRQREIEFTQYEQARRLLRNQEAQSQTLLAAFPDRILRMDAELNISELGGGSSAQRSFAARVLPDAALAALRAAAREVLDSGQVGRVEYQIQEQADQLHYEARLARAGGDHVIITIRAVTQRRRLEVDLITARETALEAARLKTKFLANMSHEIRTPMNGVIGMTNLLMETPLTEEQHEYAQIIQKSGQTLLTVIDDILDFAKIEAGKLELDEVDFDLYGCVDESVEAVLSQAFAKGLELAAVFAPGVPAAVRGDPTRLRQILANLLSNALRYCEQGSVLVHVRKADDREDGLLAFVVEDTGPGIVEERRAQLFQPILLSEGAATAQPAGTGLGLAIARELVQLMGGEITYRTTLGRGSAFEFTARLATHDTGRGSLDLGDLHDKSAWVLTLLEEGDRTPAVDLQLAALGVACVRVPAAEVALRLKERRNDQACLALLLDTRLPMAELENALAEVRPSAQALDVPIILFAPNHIGIPERLRGEVARVLSWPVRQAELSACLAALFYRARVPSPVPSDAAEPFSAHVLIADDDPINQRVLKRLLSQLGCTCEVTDDGRQAVERALSSSFDAVLMDCQMPWLDGFDATRQIRAREPGERRNRIIAMTGSSSDEDRRLSREADMDGFLTKPISVDRLRVLLRRLVAKDRGSTPPELFGPDRLIDAFLEQAPRNIDAMRAALDVGDLRAVAKTAQQLSSFARGLSEARLEAFSANLQKAAEENRGPATERALEAVSAEIASLWRTLRESRGEP